MSSAAEQALQDALSHVLRLLGLCAGTIGFTFKTVLYGLEDLANRLWPGRPEWARPAVGGVALGLVLGRLPGDGQRAVFTELNSVYT